MKYPELADLDSTPLQHAGITAFVAEVNAARAKETPSLPPYTEGAYLVAKIAGELDNMAASHIKQPRNEKLLDAFEKATDKEREDAAAILKVDLSTVAEVSAEPIK